MSFIVYDLILLVLFISLVSLFLYKNRKNLKKDGWLILYRTEWGLKLIEKIGNKNPRLMKFLSYISIFIGYILMISGIYLFLKIILIYFFRADVVAAVKVPPIMPLIPYLPQMFKLTWLPDFYFIYWILILAIIAITHEFAHGIFAAYHKIKVKKTGFGFFPYFLPVFLAAFVELDEERMQKEKIFKQLSILSAGTFANVLTAIISFALMAGFFILAFSPSGVVFSNYAYNQVNWSEVNITHINGQEIENYNANLSITDSMNISTTSGEYILNLYSLENNSMQVGEDFISILYYNSPALNANLSGAITEINNEKIYSLDKLDKEISKYNISDKIKVKTILDGKENEYELTLEESPFNSSKPWLGVAFQLDQESSSLGKIIQKANSYKDSNVYYTTRFGESSNFIYNLLWWLFLISVSVAIVNMLPVGIFDGGRFFYLTILYLTKREKIAKKSFAVMTYLFLLLIIAIMILWAKSFF